MENTRASPNRSLTRRLLRRSLVAACTVVLVVIVYDFVRFSRTVSALAPPKDPAADAIVVLTGGPDRIGAAIALLDRGAAGRMLISGVGERTSEHSLSSIHQGAERLFDCCIDIGHDALDTSGNAREARAWTEQHGFRSLIIVTSAFHMPRSLVELSLEMPDTRLVPYPVRFPALKLDAWQRHPPTLRALSLEYVKLLFARYG